MDKIDGNLIDWPVHVHGGERSGKPWLVIVRDLENRSMMVRLTWCCGGQVSVSHWGTASCCLGLPLGFVIVHCKWRSYPLVHLLGPQPRLFCVAPFQSLLYLGYITAKCYWLWSMKLTFSIYLCVVIYVRTRQIAVWPLVINTVQGNIYS